MTMSSSGPSKKQPNRNNGNETRGVAFDWVGGADNMRFVAGVDMCTGGGRKHTRRSNARGSSRQRKPRAQVLRQKSIPTPTRKQHQIIVRISTDQWGLSYQVRTTCCVPANVTPRDGVPKTVHIDTAERIDVDPYIYSYLSLHRRWKITHGLSTLLLPDIPVICDLFQNKYGGTSWNKRVYINVIHQLGDRKVRLAERMAKWRAVAWMLVLAAKVQPKITLHICNLGGDTVDIEARPFMTIRDIRAKYCQTTGVPRTPQLKLFAESKPEPLRLLAQLKSFESIFQNPHLTAFAVPLSRQLRNG